MNTFPITPMAADVSPPPPLARSLPACGSRAGFSLIEIMVAMLLLSVIIIGLVAMFGQTQGAVRVGLAQKDITESGRAVMNMVARELATAVPSRAGASNFIIYNPPLAPLVQDLPGSTNATPFRRTNALQEIVFLTRHNKDWSAIGYRVGGADGGYGTLYRFETNLPPGLLYDAPRLFANLDVTNFSRVADGVIHFRVRPTDTNGLLLTSAPITTAPQIFLGRAAQNPLELDYFFASNALPYSLGIEIGILPPRLVERLRAFPDAASRRTHLSRSSQAGAVEMFQQRVTLPNSDLSVYQ